MAPADQQPHRCCHWARAACELLCSAWSSPGPKPRTAGGMCMCSQLWRQRGVTLTMLVDELTPQLLRSHESRALGLDACSRSGLGLGLGPGFRVGARVRVGARARARARVGARARARARARAGAGGWMALDASLRPQLRVPGRPGRRPGRRSGPGIGGSRLRLGAGVGARLAAALHCCPVDLALLGWR